MRTKNLSKTKKNFEKRSFALSRDGRLLIKEGQKKPLHVNGRFSIKKNRLAYLLEEPVRWKKKYGLGDDIHLKGRWQLDKKQRLNFLLDKTGRFKKRGLLRLKAEMLDARSDSLTFIVAKKTKAGHLTHRLLTLKGRWQTDRYNRLAFLIKRTQTTEDVLLLEANWTIKENTVLTYRHTRTSLKTMKKSESYINLKGSWKISGGHHLHYNLNKRKGSYFDFKVFSGTANIRSKKGTLKYRLGVGVKGKRGYRIKEIVLFGAWKFSRRKGFSFEIASLSKQRPKVLLTLWLSPDSKNRIAFGLNKQKTKEMEVDLKLEHRFNNRAQAILRLKGINKRPSITGVFRIPW